MDLSGAANKVAPVVAAAALAVSATPVFAGDAGAGEQVFSGNCAACHAGGQNVIMPEKTLQVGATCFSAWLTEPQCQARVFLGSP
eukprot:scaffold129442_cov33-Tisochrysis_lutea.AAC.2